MFFGLSISVCAQISLILCLCVIQVRTGSQFEHTLTEWSNTLLKHMFLILLSGFMLHCGSAVSSCKPVSLASCIDMDHCFHGNMDTLRPVEKTLTFDSSFRNIMLCVFQAILNACCLSVGQSICLQRSFLVFCSRSLRVPLDFGLKPVHFCTS